MVDVDILKTKTVMEDIINKVIDKKIYFTTAKVESVNYLDYTIDVILNGYEKMTKINLRTLNILQKQDKLGMVIFPKIGSIIKVIRSGNFIFPVHIDEFEKIIIGDELSNKIEIDNTLGKITIKQGTTDIALSNTDVKIQSSKIYTNTLLETEPFVRGATLEQHLNDIYDYITDIYTKLSTHIHGSAVGPTSPAMPPESAQIPIKITEVSGDKATSYLIKSTKNFTE